MKKIMFVCSGNICQSIMAEYLFKNILNDKGIQSNYKVFSSGVFAYSGQTPSNEVVEAMMSRNIDVSQHRAVTTDETDMYDMDLILCMTSSQKLQLKSRYKEVESKIYTLKEYVIFDDAVNEDIDIDDPYKQNWKDYLECLRQIDICLNKLIRFLE